MTLRQLVHDCQRRPQDHILSKCASVCRSWQNDLERSTFHTLRLTQTCLPEFRNIVRGPKKHRLEYIALLCCRIQLDEYDCTVCQTVEDEDTIERLVLLCVKFSLVTDLASETVLPSRLRFEVCY